jgi:hypothetical protein
MVFFARLKFSGFLHSFRSRVGLLPLSSVGHPYFSDEDSLASNKAGAFLL